MSTQPVDLDRLLKLRLVIARLGEQDRMRWWGTGDERRRAAMLGSRGELLLSRGFPKTHHFAQARLVFAVAQQRCSAVFRAPGCVTLWRLPARLEDQFDARWSHWLKARDEWAGFFASLQDLDGDVLGTLAGLGLLSEAQVAEVQRLHVSSGGSAIPLPGAPEISDDTLSLLAGGFVHSGVATLAVPYARMA